MTPQNPNVPATAGSASGAAPTPRPSAPLPTREPVSPIRTDPPQLRSLTGPRGPTVDLRRPSVRVVHDARKGRPPARGFPAILAFLLITFAGLLATVSMGFWRWLLIERPAAFEQAPLVAAEFFDTHTPIILQSVAAALLLLLGVAIARLNVLRYVVAAAVSFATLHCANLLLQGDYGWERLLLPSLWAAYFICLSPHVKNPSILGLFGFLLIVAACTGCHGEWFDWRNYQAYFEKWPAARDFLADWGSEAAWAVVLLLTALGVAMSRGRMIHFCNAALLVMLAWYCINEGATHEATFTFANGVTKSIEVHGWKYVDTWRWFFAGELVLLSIILLHLALGMGSIALGFAVLWVAFGIQADQRAQRLLLTRGVYRVAQLMTTQQGGDPSRESRELEGMGLPIEATAGEQKDSKRKEESAVFTPAETVGITVTTTWALLTAMLAGLIGAAALRMMIVHPNVRHWVLLLIWGVLGALIVWLANISPKLPEHAWVGWGSNWLNFLRSEAMIAIAWVTFALGASWSLRERAQYVTWLYCAAACSFIGTLLTLGGIAVLIPYAQFPTLPVWVYVAIAAGQSSLMWALLMHRNLGAKRMEPARAIA